MTDEIAFRLASIQTMMWGVMAVFLVISAAIIDAFSPTLNATSVTLGVLATLYFWRFAAESFRGPHRRALGFFVSFERPALSDWGDEIFSNGDFSYQGKEVTADGGDDEWD